MDTNTSTALVTLHGRRATLGHLARLLGISERETAEAIANRELFVLRGDPLGPFVELTPVGNVEAGRLTGRAAGGTSSA